MTGARVTMEFDNEALSGALGRAAQVLDSPEVLMDEIGAVLEAGVQHRFIDAEDPDGTPWVESLRASLGERGGKTLSDTGQLQLSITRVVSENAVAVGTNKIHGAIHQFGGEIVAKNAPALAFTLADGTAVVTKKVTMPARPFLGVSATDRADIADLVAFRLREALTRRDAT
ncbi:phage virion morphogenesis protein [Ruegeria atlantica]|uniref:phage virion morphogenesis protein n=1 Tax=Ruegeria atlantica TaxID=81569 RepID=UPI00147E256F|nr:phage virion morphogenesis protein [Ruegeria atlantica]